MQLRSDMKAIHQQYTYRPLRRRWAVYHETMYRQGDSYPPKLSTIGTKVCEYQTREEARREVYRLNGWTYREKKV
ncbi:hypothetical protein [Bacteroides oleiciplenus]|uniref:Uncharacterized protein n=1 Tax=Bacteroides oleiciplenus TaxID=626931 RepID=A0A3E5B946_9BACE|nr:hypothetical protein [Bacteroides oleiciplenus]RGN33845.1 hypothetical protein DXB65_15305 [Bacteroides oleiciplenus]